MSLTATLEGSNEVGGGDPHATGTAAVTVDVTSGRICATVTSNIVDATMMHIHQGAAGVNGSVVVPLDAATINSGHPDCVMATTALAAQIASDPDGFYVNIHTAAFPGGALRGQLGRVT